MTILLLTIGSAGDVHPFIGLGLALRNRGHTVKLITNPYFGEAATRAGLELIPLGSVENFKTALSDPMLWHPKRGHMAVFNIVLDGLRETYDAVADNFVPGKTVLVSSSLGFAGRIAQDKLKIPTATVHLSPSHFRSCIEPPKIRGLWMPSWLPKWMKQQIWAGGDRFVLDKILAPRINALRSELGLSPVQGILKDFWNSPDRVIGLFPNWYGKPQSDWPLQTCVTGFPRFDEADSREPDPDLAQFLDDGTAPIVFTPGSAMYHGHAFFRTSLEVCKRLNRRGIFLSRHANHIPDKLPPKVRHFLYAPFSQLLPRAAALVHHGGIGTSAQAMAAACRQLITPFAHDQFDNAYRLQNLGVARVIDADRYNPKTATPILGALLADKSVRKNCQELATRIQNSDPVTRTCELIEDLALMQQISS